MVKGNMWGFFVGLLKDYWVNGNFKGVNCKKLT